MNRILDICDSFGNVFDKCMKILGPILIVFAVTLVSLGIYTYFSVFLPFHYSEEIIWTNWIYFKYFSHLIFSIWLVILIFFNYFSCIFISPGNPSLDHHSSAHELESGLILNETRTEMKTCKKCFMPKPQRAHHCSICQKCVFKMDHHCPWINNCVGHFNHRYFFLFMFYLWIGCLYFTVMGYLPFISILYGKETYLIPRSSYQMVILTYILCIAIDFALGGLVIFHSFLITRNLTTIEFYKVKIVSRGHSNPLNEFDLGIKTNLKLFFNIGKNYSFWHILLPVFVPPFGDGYQYLDQKQYLTSLNKQR